MLEKARFQPEFKAPVWDYFDNRVHENSVAVGREMDLGQTALWTRINSLDSPWALDDLITLVTEIEEVIKIAAHSARRQRERRENRRDDVWRSGSQGR